MIHRKRLGVISIILGIFLIGFFLFPDLNSLPICEITKATAQDNPCLAQDATITAQELQILRLQATNSAFELENLLLQNTISSMRVDSTVIVITVPVLITTTPEPTESIRVITVTPITKPPTSTTVPIITSTPIAVLPPTAINSQIEIVRVLNPGDITAEGVEIRNLGGVINLTGWTLQDIEGNRFTFPEQRLFTNGLLTVYTRVGQNTPIALFWGQSKSVWEDEGDAVILSDTDGIVQSTLQLP